MPLVEVKNVSDVGNPLYPSLLVANVECAGDQLLLVVLNGHHLLLNGVLRDELVDKRLLGLANPVDAVKALLFNGRVPGWVEQKQVVGGGQVETNTAGHQAQEQYLKEQ